MEHKNIQDLNRRIAMVLGWTHVHEGMGYPPGVNLAHGPLPSDVPNWAGDLNEMWDLEQELFNDTDHYEYQHYLESYIPMGQDGNQFRLTHATATQKAEAWLAVKEGR